ncbi:MAG: acyl-CoA dehydrogenase family protein [Acidobacteriota bacterium]|jgi:alkylation response protein AidB-like acyl-CoA dehydrogenase|nr:acyl-CoA dehydrogenase family protein [Acidobacteriota bacterium]
MYAFDPTDEQKIIVDAARKLALKEFRSKMSEADEKSEPAPEWMKSGWELGLLPASLPEPYGGFGEHSALTGVLAAEELAYGDLSAALCLMAPNLVAFPVLLSGTEEQKKEILPHFCAESYVSGAAALMEPRMDFDPNNLLTTATRKDGHYVLSGIKCNVPFAAESEWVVVYAMCEGRVEAFLVRRGTPGLIVKEREQNMGMKAFPLYAVELAGCTVPAAQRLGGDAGCDFARILSSSRVALSAMAVGVARAAYEFALDYAKNRKAFGEMIAQRQSIAFTLSDMITEIEAARLLVWEAAWLLDSGRDAVREAYLAMNFAGDAALMVSDRAVQILGGYGFIRDFPEELYLRNARGFGIMEGIAIV